MLPRLPLLPWPPTYGLLVALGFALGLLLARRLAERAGVPRTAVEDVVVWACLAGLLGAKLLLIVVDPESFLAAPWRLFTQAGVFYGGVAAAILWVLVHSRWRGLRAHAVGDACAPALSLAHAIGRVGCFAAGCCWGSACELPWGVRYTDPASVALGTDPLLIGTRVHPVQLYEAVGEALICVFLVALLHRRKFVGQVWWTYVLAYGGLRFALEFLRGDPRGAFLGTALSTSQGFALIGMALAVVMLTILRSRSHREGVGAPPLPAAAPAPLDASPAAGATPPPEGHV